MGAVGGPLACSELIGRGFDGCFVLVQLGGASADVFAQCVATCGLFFRCSFDVASFTLRGLVLFGKTAGFDADCGERLL